MPELKIENLVVNYTLEKKKTVRAVDGFSATFDNGSINVIIGPSGCGKTTLLKAILGLIPYEGDILSDDDDLRAYMTEERNFAYVSQDIVLQPHVTVFDNIAYPLRIRGVAKKDIIDKVNALADEMNISECLSRRPKQISIGQAQRVAIARALIKNASLYLFDEPFSNLDETNRTEGRHLISEVIRKRNATVIYVTHSIKEATALGDRIFVMDKGKLAYQGNPDNLYESDNPVVRSLVHADE